MDSLSFLVIYYIVLFAVALLISIIIGIVDYSKKRATKKTNIHINKHNSPHTPNQNKSHAYSPYQSNESTQPNKSISNEYCILSQGKTSIIDEKPITPSHDEKAVTSPLDKEAMSLVHDEKAIRILDTNKSIPFSLGHNGYGSLLTGAESVFYFQAKAYAGKNNLELFAQVRISDVIYVPTEDNFAKYRNNETIEQAIQSKSFDFVFCRKMQLRSGNIAIIPFLIVEIDDLTHKLQRRIIRDKLVDKLILQTKKRKKKIDILHIFHDGLDGANTKWRIVHYNDNGECEFKSNLMTISELLGRYT